MVTLDTSDTHRQMDAYKQKHMNDETRWTGRRHTERQTNGETDTRAKSDEQPDRKKLQKSPEENTLKERQQTDKQTKRHINDLQE